MLVVFLFKVFKLLGVFFVLLFLKFFCFFGLILVVFPFGALFVYCFLLCFCGVFVFCCV